MLERVLEGGAPEIVREFQLGLPEDLARIERGGCLAGARASAVSDRAKQRGHDQLGTLGGGTHFLEIQRVQAIFDAEAARALGLSLDQITVLIHAAANFAFANREVLTHRVRQVFAALTSNGRLDVVYDVAHNVAKIEEHLGRRVCVHRKGATRAFVRATRSCRSPIVPSGSPCSSRAAWARRPSSSSDRARASSPLRAHAMVRAAR